MKRYSFVACLARISVCLSVLLVAPAMVGAAADRPQVQARLLDHAELPCDNCFFGPSYYYYCFEADNKILIGYQKTRVLNWEDKSKNRLTRIHKAWTVWTPPGETVPISYDDTHIWVAGLRGKSVKLTQTYSRDVFTSNDRCRAAVGTKTR